MSKCWGAYIFKFLGCPPLHLQTNIIPFTHAYWWQSCRACVWIFKLLVSPSSRKNWKKRFPLIGKQQELHRITFFFGFAVLRCFAEVCGYLRAFAGYLRAFCGAFSSQKASQKASLGGFCGICESLRFHNPFRMPQSSSVLCGENLDLLNAF